MSMQRRSALVLPAALSVGLIAGCGPTGSMQDVAALDAMADATADGVSPCADPNRLPMGAEFGCWTCPPPPAMATMYIGQPTGYRCSVCVAHPTITMPPRGDCYACSEPDGGPPQGFC